MARTISTSSIARLRGLHEDPARLLVDLRLEGTLVARRSRAPGARPGRSRRRAAFPAGRRRSALSQPRRPRISRRSRHEGFVRIAAEKLRAMADDPNGAGARGRGPGAAPPVCRAPQAERAMKLRALELEQFRKFDRALWIAGMADGLNLIVGPNEMGKSTVFAALQAVLFERHRSQAQTVRSFQPAGHEGAVAAGRPELRDRRPALIGSRSASCGGRAPSLRCPTAAICMARRPRRRWIACWPAARGAMPAAGGGARPRCSASGACSGSARASRSCCRRWRRRRAAALQAALEARGRRGPRRRSRRPVDQDRRSGACTSWSTRRDARAAATRRPTTPAEALELEIADLEARREELERDLNDLDGVRPRTSACSRTEHRVEAEAELAALVARRDAAHGPARGDPGGRGRSQGQAHRARAMPRPSRPGGGPLRDGAGGSGSRVPGARPWPRPMPARAAAEAERLAAEQAGKVERLQATFDAAGNQQRALQRLVQAIRQRDDGRAALRAAASEVALELEPAALERVRVGGRPLGASQPVAPDRRSAGDRDRGHWPDHGASRRARPQASAGSLREAERRIADELKILGLHPPSARARQLEFALAAGGSLPGTAAGLGIARGRRCFLARGGNGRERARRDGATDQRSARAAAPGPRRAGCAGGGPPRSGRRAQPGRGSARAGGAAPRAAARRAGRSGAGRERSRSGGPHPGAAGRGRGR